MSITQSVSRMRYAVCSVVLTVALAASGGMRTSTAQDIVRLGNAQVSLAERVAQATRRATSQAFPEGHAVMLGYEITVRVPEREIWGMYSLRETSLPTLAELIDGRRIEDADSRGRSGSDRFVERRAAVMIRLSADGLPTDVHLYTFDTIADFRTDTILWLGDATLASSFDLLLPYVDSDHDVDVRRGSVYAIARHGLPDRALPVLTGLIRDTSEPDELRKAAIYGLGMFRSEAARRTLLDLIYDETS